MLLGKLDQSTSTDVSPALTHASPGTKGTCMLVLHCLESAVCVAFTSLLRPDELILSNR